MSVIAAMTFSDPILFGPTFEEASGAELTIEDAHYVQSGQDAVQYVIFGWVSGSSTDAFETAVTADGTIESFRRLVELDDRVLYRFVTPDLYPAEEPLFYPLCREHDVTVLESRRTATGFHVRIRAPSRAGLREFQRALVDRGASIDVTRLSSEAEADPGFDELTDKQRNALSLAYERGYFRTPKETTLSELAEEVGVTPQTLSRHLRVAVESVVERAVTSGPYDAAENGH